MVNSKCTDVQKLFNIVNKLRNEGVYRFEIHRFVDMECDLHDRLFEEGQILIDNRVFHIVEVDEGEDIPF